ncbi:MAG: hypothetical protein JST75_15240 [Bacteroidetes bacterium]|nr:hypothetical protein [Bacteroidota bacterium]
MKELIDQYAHYNLWAHKRLLDFINTLNMRQHHQQIASSFNSLYKTVLHVWAAETIWFKRFDRESIRIDTDPFNASMKELSDSLIQLDQKVLDWVLNKDESALVENLTYRNLKGEEFSQPYYLLLMHLFNHGTYHNGQIVTMLRQLKMEKIPDTDFIVWTRL